ncbi:MAG: ROK family protein [Lactimicrobium massiliense]|nr:ROK family protein [Lactimicrobium massiliense]MDD6726719.1 ROK family protein [Lactimicrobium massiliense]
MSEYLTIDVGGTAVKYALMNEEAEIAEKGEVATPHDSQEEFINLVVGLYQKYQDRVEGIAMSAPGRIDASRGYFYTSGALGYLDHTDFAALLADKVKVPFRLENDAKSAALAELWKGSMQGVANGTVITLGTGIGGAIIINGKLYRGSTFAAGEYSPISTRLDLPFDTKNMWATQNSVGSLIGKYAELSGQDASQLNGRILFERANHGDQQALDALQWYCQGLAAGLLTIQTILDVERVAIGGGISKQPLLLKTLQDTIEKMAAPYLAFMPFSLPEIVACTFGNDANMIGALYHFLNE